MSASPNTNDLLDNIMGLNKRKSMKAELVELLKSKSTYTGIAAICGGIIMLLNKDYNSAFTTILGGLSVIFIRHAIVKQDQQ